MDIRAATLAQGLALADPANTVLQKQSNDQYLTALSGALGDAVVQQVNQISRMQPAANLVYDISSLAPPGSIPLTSIQSGQLLQILANSSPNYQSGGNVDLGTINWDIAYPQVTAILSGPQLQAFNAEAQMFRLGAKVNQFYSQQPASK
jgi:hypothetical protein